MKKVLVAWVLIFCSLIGTVPSSGQIPVTDLANISMNGLQLIEIVEMLIQGYDRFEELRESNGNWEEMLTKWLMEDAAALGIDIDSDVARLVIERRDELRKTANGIIYGEETSGDLRRIFSGFDFNVEPPSFKDFEQEMGDVIFESGGALLDVVGAVVEESDALYDEREIAREMVFNASGTDQINQGLGALLANLGETMQSSQQVEASMANAALLQMVAKEHRAGFYEKSGLLFATEGAGEVTVLQGGLVPIDMWVR